MSSALSYPCFSAYIRMARSKNPELRDKILHAAAREFAEAGFAGASMGSIGRAADVTKGGVYFHFRSKEELFFAVLDRWSSGLRAALPAAGRGSGSGARHLHEFVAAFLDYHFRHPHGASLLRVAATEMQARFTAQLREDLGGSLRALRARIRDLLTEGARDGSLFATDPAQAAFLLAGAVEGIVQQWLASPPDVEPYCDAESLAEGLVAPYVTGAPAQPGGDTEPAAVFQPPL